ncbi:MAG TPA: prolyl oligopeptidase family serine peptidase, partial [Nitrosospira sp.]|nr:prolyl oligopeptidase family serine peptidase [Nitrosospira sp.]
RVYVPKDRAAGQKLPVMLYLHGSGSRGTDNRSQIEGFNKFIRDNPRNFNFIIVFPQGSAETFWDPAMLAQAVAALDQTVKEFDGDEKRLYVSGWSLGAVGAWHAVLLYPNKFAAVVPIAGRIIPMDFEANNSSAEILAMGNAADPFAAFAEKLKDTPTWIFHGGEDKSMPLTESRAMHEALINAGNPDVRYTEYQGMGHYAVEAAFTEPRLFEWLAAKRSR